MLEKTVVIKNESGLHARPAANFVRLASKYKSEVTLEKDGIAVNGKSIIGVMVLACEKGSSITIRTEGLDEKATLDALVELVENNFNFTP